MKQVVRTIDMNQFAKKRDISQDSEPPNKANNATTQRDNSMPQRIKPK